MSPVASLPTFTIGGLTVDDPCAWLREESEEALAWQQEQSDLARDEARALPSYDWCLKLNRQHQTADHSLFFAPRLLAGTWFRRERGDEAPGVYAGTEWDEPGRALITVAELVDADDDRPVQLWFFEPSADGRYCAVAYGLGGDAQGHWLVVETTTGTRLPVRAPSLLFNSPRPGWLPGDQGFLLAARTDEGGHRFSTVRLDGRIETAVDFALDTVPASIPALVPQVSPGGSWVTALSAPHELAVRQIGNADSWRAFLPDDYRGECYGDWRDDDTYVAIVTEGSPRGRVVAIPAATSTDRTTWQELVPQTSVVLRSISVVPEGLVLLELRDVSLAVRVVGAGQSREIAVPPHSSTMRTLLRLPQRSDALVIDHQSFTTAPALARIDADRASLESRPAAAALDGIAVEQCFAIADDGTRLPFYVVQRADLPQTGKMPTLVYAYGGYNAPVTPAFLAHNLPFVLAGGRYVVANLRGGGEYGEEWHEAGRLMTKQRTYDDLFVIVDHLVAAGLATPDRLAFQGFSNGGATAGVALTQRPDLWRAVVPGAPMLDFLQWVQGGSEAEAMRSYFTSEFGDPTDPAVAPGLHAMSPYHNVRDGLAYPAVFSVFGALDPGCPPHSGRLLTERLRNATTSGLPVHLRVWHDTGHGAIGEAGAQWDAEWMAFVLDQLGMAVPSP